MSKATRDVFEAIKKGESSKSMGFIEAAIEGLKVGMEAFAPGLTLDNILRDVGSELHQMGTHGAHELSATLFNGSAYVMYPRGRQSVDDPQHGLPQQEQQIEEQSQGRGM